MTSVIFIDKSQIIYDYHLIVKVASQNLKITQSFPLRILLASTLGILCVILLLINQNKEFDKQSWLDNKGTQFKMAKDLINRKILIGADTAKVRKLLGEPNSKPNDTLAINRWIYSMGERYWVFKPKIYGLIIRFTNNKVSNAGMYEIEKY